jgi:hypothetical protein
MKKLFIMLRQCVGTTRIARRPYRILPSARRCKECLVPFRLLQIRPSRKNPNLCTL